MTKKSRGGRIIIALLGNENESDAITPATRDIATVVGNFSSVADLISETAVKTRAADNRPEAGKAIAEAMR